MGDLVQGPSLPAQAHQFESGQAVSGTVLAPALCQHYHPTGTATALPQAINLITRMRLRQPHSSFLIG